MQRKLLDARIKNRIVVRVLATAGRVFGRDLCWGCIQTVLVNRTGASRRKRPCDSSWSRELDRCAFLTVGVTPEVICAVTAGDTPAPDNVIALGEPDWFPAMLTSADSGPISDGTNIKAMLHVAAGDRHSRKYLKG